MPSCTRPPWMSITFTVIRPSMTMASPGLRVSSSTTGRLALLEPERLVQRAHGQLQVLVLDHHGDLDLGSRDHLDVDAVGGQRLEHLAGDAGVRAHAHADQRHLANVIRG